MLYYPPGLAPSPGSRWAVKKDSVDAGLQVGRHTLDPGRLGREHTPVGCSVGGAIQGSGTSTINSDLDILARAGCEWLRIDISWSQIQASGSSSFDWTNIDTVVNAATARNMRVLGMIGYTPSWARPGGTTDKYGPDPTAFAAFAKTAAQHYAALGVHTFEVWNEPNAAFWTPAPDPLAYATLLKAAYPAIKAGDPSAFVLTGGTAPAPTDGFSYAPADWYTALYSYGIHGYFDALAHHPYCTPAYPGEVQTWSAWWQMYGPTPSIRSAMIANGDEKKKIWATEWGAPTNGPGGNASVVSEATQADMLRSAFQTFYSYDWSGPLFVYQHRDGGTATTDAGNFYGLTRNDGTSKPSHGVFAAARMPSSGPINAVLDDFTRANGALGGSWQARSDTPTLPVISSNKASNSSTNRTAAVWPTGYTGDVEVYATLSSLPNPTSNGVDLVLHEAPATTGYYGLFIAPGASGAGIYRRNANGSTTTLEAFASLAPAAGDSFMLRRTGNHLQAWSKPAAGVWAPLSAGVTDATYKSGQIGFFLGATTSTAAQLDDFGGGEIKHPFIVTETEYAHLNGTVGVASGEASVNVVDPA